MIVYKLMNPPSTTLQSFIALVTITLVAARAVNILKWYLITG